MKYEILEFQSPQALVKFSTDDDLHSETYWVRIDLKDDGSVPGGGELDSYILSFAPVLPKVDPYAGVDWSNVTSRVKEFVATPESFQPTRPDLIEILP